MQHKGTIQIETERLVLRRFNLNDAEAMFKNWTNDSRVTEFLRWKCHDNIEISKEVLENWLLSYNNANFYQWAICFKEMNEPIGTISVVDFDDLTEKVHIGYCIGSKWWRMGITSEALSAIIPFFFEEVGVNRIESMHDPNNPNSGKVMQKCGMIYEGTLKQSDWSNKGIVDASYYSILASDYFKSK